MSCFGNSSKWVLVSTLILLSACEQLFSTELDMGQGYRLSVADKESYSILVDGQVLVGPTIVSYAFNELYIVGLRLEAEDVVCKSGPTKMVTDTKSFFVINKHTERLEVFSNRDSFLARLLDIDPQSLLDLDYKAFDREWAFYNSIYSRPEPNYFLSCKKVDE